MDEMWGPVVACLGFTMLVITPYIVNRVIKYKLEIARINSETTIRAEEIRSKNQFELEKYLKEEENDKNKNSNRNHDINDEDSYGNSNKSRVRI